MNAKKPYVKMITITPSIAREWLRRNVKNQRKLKPQKIKDYAVEMLAGRWSSTAGEISFDTKDRMFNGQHRLLAIIRANIPVDIQVKFNCDPEDFKKIDRGAARDNGDVLQILGEDNAKVLSSSINWAYKIDQVLQEGRSEASIRPGGGLGPDDMMEFLSLHPDIRDSVKAMMKIPVTRLAVTRALAVAIHYFFSTQNKRQATEFVRAVFEGDGLSKRSPEFMLRERLLTHATSRATKAKLNHLAQVGYFFKAWKASRTGLIPERLLYKAQARTPEKLRLG